MSTLLDEMDKEIARLFGLEATVNASAKKPEVKAEASSETVFQVAPGDIRDPEQQAGSNVPRLCPALPVNNSVPAAAALPPEIGDLLEGCYKLEPDGAVTPVMDLSLESLDGPAPRFGSAARHGRKPMGIPWASLLLAVSLVLLMIAALPFVPALFGHSVFGLSFYAAPDGLRGAMPRGVLAVTRQVNPSSLSLGDNVVYAAYTGEPVLGKIAGISEAGGVRRFQLRTASHLPDDTAAAGEIVGVVIAALPGLGALFGLIWRYFPWSLAAPAILLLAAARWKLAAGRKPSSMRVGAT